MILNAREAAAAAEMLFRNRTKHEARMWKKLADWAWDYRHLIREMWRDGDGPGDPFLCVIEDEAGIEPPPQRPKTGRPRASISATKRLRIYARDLYCCLSCGTNVDLSIDHIVPWSKGGSNDDDNLQTLCRSCNIKKGASL